MWRICVWLGVVTLIDSLNANTFGKIMAWHCKPPLPPTPRSIAFLVRIEDVRLPPRVTIVRADVYTHDASSATRESVPFDDDRILFDTVDSSELTVIELIMA